MKTVSSVTLTPHDIFKLVESDLLEVEIALKAESKAAFPLVDDINISTTVEESAFGRYCCFLRPSCVDSKANPRLFWVRLLS